MKNIAVVAGGNSGEYSVSLKSQAALISFLSPVKEYRLFPVLIERDGWRVTVDGEVCEVDKNDFSFTGKAGEKVKFDYCYMTIHGTPGEDGLFLGYLETMGIPFSSCSALVSALTFNKAFCNRYLSSFGIPVSRGLTVRREEPLTEEEILAQLTLPLFVKPNCGGSSIATHKVERPEELRAALDSAFTAGEEVLVERMLIGTEVTCGCYEDAAGLHALPVTEVVPKTPSLTSMRSTTGRPTRSRRPGSPKPSLTWCRNAPRRSTAASAPKGSSGWIISSKMGSRCSSR